MFPRAIRAIVFSVFLLVLVVISNGCTGLQSGGTQTGGSTVGATASPIKHVIVVSMVGRSFDNLFGKYTPMAGQTVNGITPAVPSYTQRSSTGTMVTPFEQTNPSIADLPHNRTDFVTAWDNGAMDMYASHEGNNSMGYYTSSMAGIDTLWNYANAYALADNYFPSLMGSSPGNPLYLVAASDNDYPYSVQPSYGPCNTADPASKPYTFPNVGDQLTQASVSWGFFQEAYGACGSGYVDTHNPFQYFTSTHAAANVQDLSAFYAQLDGGNLPAVSFVQPNDTHGGHAGSGSITASMSWLDGFIQRVKASPEWDSTAIVVLWNHSGGFWDHVSPPQIDSQGLGARVPLLVVSPFAKAGYVSHVQMDHVSVLKFIQWNWSLATLNPREDQSTDIRDMFQF